MDLEVASENTRRAILNLGFAAMALPVSHTLVSEGALSLPRRLELLEWASRRRAWIIEDDYDSEFCYPGQPLPALKSLDRDERVLYTDTFSKVLFPGLRLTYLVLPAPQVEKFRDAVEHLPGCNQFQAL